jgi:hypothetical protein
MSLAAALRENYVKVHATGKESNDLLDELFDSVAAYFDSDRFKKEADFNYGWFRLVDAKRKDQVRLGTWCLRSLATKRPKLLAPTNNDVRSDDGSGAYYYRAKSDSPQGPKTLISANPIAHKVPHKTRHAIESYLSTLLEGELSAINEAAKTAGKANHYRAVVSVDFYNSRSLNAVGAHKDTTGNTLFVALHYRNPQRMAGPEYIIDRWPIPAADGVTEYFKTARPERRTAAPWAYGPKPLTFWPRKLLQALEEARAQLAKDHADIRFESSVLGPYGLISFVDELIYHLTPLREHRQSGGSYDGFNSVGIAPSQSFDVIPGLPNLVRSADILKRSGNWLYCGPQWVKYELDPQAQGRQKIERRMSTDLSSWTSSVPSTTGGLQVRQFLRLWISIVPANWYHDVR